MRRMAAQDDEFERKLFNLSVATADQSDPNIDRAIGEVLRLVREHLEMDVAFVSRLHDGQRIFKRVEPDDGRQVIATGGADPIETSFCQRVIQGRLPQLVRDVAKLPNFAELPPTPFSIGAHLSTPIVLADGSIYGTLCCFSFSPNEALMERDLKRLKMAAQMTARLLDQERLREQEDAPHSQH
jgi:GAF domain-containing protein